MATAGLVGLWSAPPAGCGGLAPVPPGVGWFGLGRLPTDAGPSARGADELGLRRGSRAAGATTLAGAHRRAPRLSGCHHRDRARRAAGSAPTPKGISSRRPRPSSQAHPTTVLVTVDLGFNDLLGCLRHQVVDTACVDGSLATVHNQLAQILAAVEAAAPSGARDRRRRPLRPVPRVTISGVPADRPSRSPAWRDGATRRHLGRTTPRPGCRSPTSPQPSTSGTISDTSWSGLPTVPTDVARTCALTWMCDGPPLGHNVHPDDAGYRAIASAIAAAVAGT